MAPGWAAAAAGVVAVDVERRRRPGRWHPREDLLLGHHHGHLCELRDHRVGRAERPGARDMRVRRSVAVHDEVGRRRRRPLHHHQPGRVGFRAAPCFAQTAPYTSFSARLDEALRLYRLNKETELVIHVFGNVPLRPGMQCVGEDRSIYRRGARRCFLLPSKSFRANRTKN